MQINAWKDHGATQVSGGAPAAGGPPHRPAGGTDSSGPAHRPGPRAGGLMVQAMKQTLGQMGLTPTGSSEASDTSTATGSGTDGATAERGTSPQAGPPAGPPPDLASALGSLATQAAKGQAPSELQEAFQKLVQDLQGSSSEGSGGSTTTLQSFLQTLQRNLGPDVLPQLPSTGQSLQEQA